MQLKTLLFIFAMVSVAGNIWAVPGQVVLTPVKDNTLYEDSAGNFSNGIGKYLFAGQTGSMGSQEPRRALLAFDTSAIPSNSAVTAVNLAMTVNKIPNDGVPPVPAVDGTLHRVLGDWGEAGSLAPGPEGSGGVAQTGDATWIHQFFNTQNWIAPGGDYVPTPSQTVDLGDFADNTVNFTSNASMISDVQTWVSDPASNFGWVVIGDESSDKTARRFYSRESIGDVPGEVPILTVNFNIPSPVDHLELEELTDGLNGPVGIANAGDGSGRVFVVERHGYIRIFDTQTQALLSTPYLDIHTLVDSTGGEQGLLGLAFHPDFANNRRFYVYYIRNHQPGSDDRSVISRFQQSIGDPNVADTTETVLMEFEQDDWNHNGGDLHFGSDGFLYISTGDGGGGGDTYNNAQDIFTLMGNILRIDVDSTPSGDEKCGLIDNYAIPVGNAFPGGGDGCDEILHYGLRNPWRFSFDALTDDMYIGDVGQGDWEEVDFAERGSSAINFGWPCFEGTHVFRTDNLAVCPNPVNPIIEYEQGPECAITGGYLYRGSSSSMYGSYVYGDYCSDRIWVASPGEDGWQSEEWPEAAGILQSISAFGQDEDCELYVADTDAGRLFRIDDANQISRSGFETISCR